MHFHSVVHQLKMNPHLRGCLLDSRLETQLKHISEIQKHGSRNGDIALANHFEYIYDSSSATLTTYHFTALYHSSLAPSPLVNLARLFLLKPSTIVVLMESHTS